MNSPLVSLADFQALAGLSDGAVVWLLKENKLPVVYSRETGLAVDATAATVAQLIEAIMHEHKESLVRHESLLMEKIGAIISAHLETILDEAVSRIGAAGDSPRARS